MRILLVAVLAGLLGVWSAGCEEPSSSAAPTIPKPSVAPPRISPTIEIPPPINEIREPGGPARGLPA